MSETVQIRQPHSLIRVVQAKSDEYKKVCTCQLRSQDVTEDGRIEFPVADLDANCPYHWRRIPKWGKDIDD